MLAILDDIYLFLFTFYVQIFTMDMDYYSQGKKRKKIALFTWELWQTQRSITQIPLQEKTHCPAKRSMWLANSLPRSHILRVTSASG